MEPMTPAPRSRLDRFLNEAGIEHELVEHRAVFAALDEVDATGTDAASVAKTLVLHGRDDYRIAVIPAGRRLDMARARGAALDAAPPASDRGGDRGRLSGLRGRRAPALR